MQLTESPTKPASKRASLEVKPNPPDSSSPAASDSDSGQELDVHGNIVVPYGDPRARYTADELRGTRFVDRKSTKAELEEAVPFITVSSCVLSIIELLVGNNANSP